MEEVPALKKEIEDTLKEKGRMLFLYLDGITEEVNGTKVNLSELIVQEGLGFEVDKEFNEVDCYINNVFLNEKTVF